MKLWLDLETFSPVPINNGSHAYAEKAGVLLFAYAVDDGPVQCWDATDGTIMPEELWEGVIGADEYWWQNGGMFDRVILKHAMPAFYKRMREDKWRDTMVQALCHGLPGKLDTLCDIFKLDADLAKNKRGKQLIQMFCKPQSKTSKLQRKTRETHPAEWAEFIEYAKSDIRSMRALHAKMPKWNYPNNKSELALWHLDQRINMSGVYVDLELANKAIEAVDIAQAELASRTEEATHGEVQAATQRDALLAHILKDYGVSLPDMRADTLERRLSDPSLPDGVKDLIGLRLMSSTSSVSKFKRLRNCVSSDGYLRGIIQFCGAGRTGRDAGRLFQPQNLMRPTLDAKSIEHGIDAIKLMVADLITDNVMELCANTMRGVIIAPPGRKLVVADLSNIEGRVLAWLAGEEWKLQAFRDFDTIIDHDRKGKAIRKGPDLYILSYATAFRMKLADVPPKMRQIGKVMELGLGFGGGVGAFLTFAATYGLDLEAMTAQGRDSIPAAVWEQAESFYEWSKETKRSTYGLSKEVFCMCDSLKRLWRAAHPKTEALWKRAEFACRIAIDEADEPQKIGEHAYAVRNGNWLRIVLPSCRALSYPSPRAGDSITYMGMSQYTRKWERIKTYGGKLVENMTQAVARDVFKGNAPLIVAAGYDIKLPVHDEDITYAPDRPEFNPDHLSGLLATNPEWALDLPLAAAGFEGYRYRKD